MPPGQTRNLQADESVIAGGQSVAAISGILVIGQDRVIAHSPELTRLFPALLQARPSIHELPVAVTEILNEVLSSGKAAARREIPLPAHGTVLDFSALSLSAPPGPRVVLAVVERVMTSSKLDSLRRADRLASLGTLSASMAHEVRNAFVAVKTFIDLLLEQHPDTDLAGLVRREMGRIDSLVAQMLRFAAPANPGRKQIALHATIEHTLRMMAPSLKTRAVKLQKQLGAEPDLIAGDDYQLEQAILNLLLNAVEAMGAEGTLTITTANLPAGDPRAAGTELATRPCVLLSLADTGPGISPEARRRLFEPFYTTKPHGTGLGLTITRRIVKEHDGIIVLASEPGRGCTFTLLFPVGSAAS